MYGAKVSIPATIQEGASYNNDYSQMDFRGEGFADGDVYHATVVTKDISATDGSDVDLSVQKPAAATVTDGQLTVTIGNLNKFTTIEFVKGPRK